jgi:hypothetical protein
MVEYGIHGFGHLPYLINNKQYLFSMNFRDDGDGAR